MTAVRFILLTYLCLFLAPLAVHAGYWLAVDEGGSWSRARWTSAGLLPPAARQSEASIHVYAARTGRWKGIFAHHCWIVLKDKGGKPYVRYDKVGWGSPVRVDAWPADAYWYGHAPVLVGKIDGAEAERLIPAFKAAIAAYPFARTGDYRVWPGPNSNTFVAHVLASVPEAGLSLPPTALGKDFHATFFAAGLTPSQTGLQVALGGLIGLTVGWVEGIEVNVLGLVAGLDLRTPAVKLPGFGRIGLPL